MQKTFWNTVAIIDARRVLCFVLSTLAALLAILANVDYSFVDLLANSYSVMFAASTTMCIVLVAAIYQRPRYMW